MLSDPDLNPAPSRGLYRRQQASLCKSCKTLTARGGDGLGPGGCDGGMKGGCDVGEGGEGGEEGGGGGGMTSMDPAKPGGGNLKIRARSVIMCQETLLYTCIEDEPLSHGIPFIYCRYVL